jgi:hypothetical protein
VDRLTYLQRLVDRSDRLRDIVSRTGVGLITGITLVLTMQSFIVQSLDQEMRSQARKRGESAAAAAGKTLGPDFVPEVTGGDMIGIIGGGVGWLAAAAALVFALLALCKANGILLGREAWHAKGESGVEKATLSPDWGTIANVTSGLGPKGLKALEAVDNETLKDGDVTKVVAAAELDLQDAAEAQMQGQDMLARAAVCLLFSPVITFGSLFIRHMLLPK